MFAIHRQNRRNLILPVAILAAHALAILLSSPASAATRSWDGGGGADTDFTTDANWSSNLEPGASDIALFDRGAAFNYTVAFPRLFPLGDIANDRLVVGSNTVTFEPAFPTDYYLTNTTTIEVDPILGTPVRGITIGAEANDTAAVLVSHLALLQAAAATLGHAAASSGTLTLNQINDLLNITGGSTANAELIIGRLGTGILNVLAGADVTVNGLVSGFPGGTVSLGRASSGQGTANISGASSTLDVNTLIVVGDAGSGTLNVSAGGFVESLSGILGDLGGSTGTATINGSGSKWTSGALFVGDAGTGTLNVLDGGVVEVTSLGGININGISTLNLDAGTIDGNVNNGGHLNVTGLATITGSLDNAVGANTLIDWAEPVGVAGLDVGGDVTNAGAVNIMIDYAEPVGIAALHVGGNVANSGSVNLTIDYAEPVGIAALDVDGSFTNSGVVSVDVDYAEPVGARAVAVAGNMTNNGTFDLIIDWEEPVGLVGLNVGETVTNNGAINITRAAEQDLTVQVGAGQTFTNGATGVVNLTGPGDVNGDLMIGGKHIIAGNVVNNGQLNVRTNARIGGSLSVAVNAETVVEPASPCCGMTLEVAGPVSNSGTFTVASAVEQDVTIQLAPGQTFTNSASGTVNLDGPAYVDGDTMITSKHIIAGNVVNNGQLNVRANAQISGSLTIAVDAETLIDRDGGADCCPPTLGCAGCCRRIEVGGGVFNSGTLTMITDSALSTLAVELAVSGTFTNNATGVLQGTGTIDGNVLNRGEVRPGNSTGVLTITGDYEQESDGRIVVEVAGTTAGSGYDQLAIGGAIALDGAVEVIFDEGFVPQIGNRFEIITTAQPINDNKFADAFLPGLPEGMDWNVLYGANLVTLAISVPGDFNGDGAVDGTDLAAWAGGLGLGEGASQSQGDADDDQDVDGGDFLVWQQQFGSPAPAVSANAPVPEPATFLLCVVATAGIRSMGRQLRQELVSE